MTDGPTWEQSIDFLLDCSDVPHARATAALLEQARDRWRGRVVPRTSMHSLLFTIPGQPYPFDQSVLVSWTDDVFEFQLVGGGVVQAADRCHEATAPAVLDAFLAQLVGGEA